MNQAQIIFVEYPFFEEHDDSSEVEDNWIFWLKYKLNSWIIYE